MSSFVPFIDMDVFLQRAWHPEKHPIMKQNKRSEAFIVAVPPLTCRGQTFRCILQKASHTSCFQKQVLPPTGSCKELHNTVTSRSGSDRRAEPRSAAVGENLSQDGESSAERLHGAGQRRGGSPLAGFQGDAL